MTGKRSPTEHSSTAPPQRPIAFAPCVAVIVVAALGLYLAGVALASDVTGRSQDNHFTLWLFLAHILLGGAAIVGGLVLGVRGFLRARRAGDRRRQVAWPVLMLALVAILVSGSWLFGQAPRLERENPQFSRLLYGLHIIAPIVALAAIWQFRRTATRPTGFAPVKVVAATLLLAGGLWAVHVGWSSPQQTSPVAEQAKFFPALTRTDTGEFLDADILMRDRQCQSCHADVHADWNDSAHRFSSFNNPPYLASVRETERKMLALHGSADGIRFCAGCHDPVPLLSGKLDDPQFDDETDPTAHAGITCTVCHAITDLGEGHGVAPRGNGDYTIAAPRDYPLAGSGLNVLNWLSQQLLLSKPAVHKQTYLKPLHKTPEFCGTCHKVHLPPELNDYKFLRGQNHYDSFIQSGVAGYGARSFYYPPHAADNCATCHMPPRESHDLGAFDARIRDHQFPAANTALPALRGNFEVAEFHGEFLRDALRVDLFGIREEGRIDGDLHAPLRPEVPELKPGGTYLLETVIRNLRVGHHFTQGTADSNEVWLDVTLTDGDGQIIGRSGEIDDDGHVDRWAHFVNAFIIDRNGHRISRRNAQDIFVPVYNHQIPPGAAQTVHYGFTLPESITGPLTIDARLRYRKFDREFMEFVSRDLKRSELLEVELPIVDIARDTLQLPVAGSIGKPAEQQVVTPTWERWNDYGIGLLLNGRAELKQAEGAFGEVRHLGKAAGAANLARVLINEGRLAEAIDVLDTLEANSDPSAPWWTVSWLKGTAAHRLGNLSDAEKCLRAVIEADDPKLRERGFDFSRDYVVVNQLGEVLFDHARTLRDSRPLENRDDLLREAAELFGRTLVLDSENVTAHHNLAQIYEMLGESEKAERHRALHLRYKPDESALGEAIQDARARYPAANHAAADVVIYDLQRSEASEQHQQPQRETRDQS